MEASGESGKVAKEDEVEALLLHVSTTQDLSQAGGTPCLGLHKKKVNVERICLEAKEEDKGKTVLGQ